MTIKASPGDQTSGSTSLSVAPNVQPTLTPPRTRGGVVNLVLQMKEEVISLSQENEKGDSFNNKVQDLITLSSSGGDSVSLTLQISSLLTSLKIPNEAHSVLITRLLALGRANKRETLRPVQQVKDLSEGEFKVILQEFNNQLNLVVESGGPLNAVPAPKGLSVNDYGKILKILVDASLTANRRARLLRMQVESLRSRVKALRSKIQQSQLSEAGEIS